ncbi:MAG: transposase family protein [Holophagaceae bacterium]|nr:transposase family protein [Holophagaceae bacterium]
MKMDGLLGRNFLKGMQGDAINAILCGAGHNLRKILARLRALLYLFEGGFRKALEALLAKLEHSISPQEAMAS